MKAKHLKQIIRSIPDDNEVTFKCGTAEFFTVEAVYHKSYINTKKHNPQDPDDPIELKNVDMGDPETFLEIV